MPSVHQRPLPSPDLSHDWVLDTEARPSLTAWGVSGLWLPLNKAFGVLANLPSENLAAGYVLGQDTRYWRTVTNLVMEVLAEQKFLPMSAATSITRAGSPCWTARATGSAWRNWPEPCRPSAAPKLR